MSLMSDLREERRRDRAAAAEQARLDREHDLRLRREDRERRRRERQQRIDRWMAAIKSANRWIARHPIDLLMSVIVIVPGLLAWTAMATFGADIYGPLGALFPLFSEAASWVFAFAVQRARRRGGPVRMLMTGLVITTAIQGALNFAHGAMQGPLVGLVMALVSVSGVVIHQIHVWSDRQAPTREERRQQQLARLAARRRHRMEMTAVREAPGQLHPDGSVRLLVRPGTVQLRRSRLRPWQRRLAYIAPIPGVGADGADTKVSSIAEETEAWLASIDPSELASIAPRSTHPDPAADLHESTLDRGSVRTPDRRSDEQLEAEFWAAIEQQLPLDEGRPIDPSSAESIRRGLRCSPRRARALRDTWKRTGGAGGASPVAA